MNCRALAVDASRRLLGQTRTRELRQRLRVLRTYHRLKPHRIRMRGSVNWLWVNPDDERGWGLIVGLGRGHQPALRTLWKEVVVRISPDTVLDVGLNYGEFLLAEAYTPATRLFGVEANPRLRPLLERSRRAHPNRQQIELVFALASDRAATGTDFHINRRWSGASTATTPREAPGDHDLVVVPVTTVDDILRETPPGEVLLFKIDVEGWESHVLSGMQQTLDAYSVVIGLVEFDEVLLRAAGADPGAFAESLARRFFVYSVDRDGSLTPVVPRAANPAGVLETLRAVNCRNGHAVTDLLLLSDGALAASLSDFAEHAQLSARARPRP